MKLKIQYNSIQYHIENLIYHEEIFEEKNNKTFIRLSISP